MLTNRTFVEKGHYVVGRRKSLEWARVRNPSPRGLIFVPPLIGGSLSQQVSSFRSLIRREYDLVSFNYSGHGSSSDQFSLGATIRDTFYMLTHTYSLCKKEQLPLFGIASCYSAIPILYAVHHLAEPLKGLVLINAIPNLSPRAVMRSFLAYYRRVFPTKRSLRRGMFAAKNYVESLFPGVVKSKDCFGTLERGRTRLFRTISEFFTLNPLEGVRLQRTPVLCLYARQDMVLEIYDAGVGPSYEKDIRRTCPQALFHSLDGDHFISLPPTKDEILRHINSFFQPSLQAEAFSSARQ